MECQNLRINFSQSVIRIVNEEYGIRGNQGTRVYIDRAIERARDIQSRRNDSTSTNESASPSRGDDSVGGYISRKGRYAYEPHLYVTSVRPDGRKSLVGNVIYTKEALLSNSSELHLAEHQKDVPDLLPTQENNALFESKYTNSSKKTTNSAIKGSKNLFSLAGSPIMVREAGREPQQRQEGAITDEQIEQLNNLLGLRYNTEQSEILYRTTNETDQELTKQYKRQTREIPQAVRDKISAKLKGVKPPEHCKNISNALRTDKGGCWFHIPTSSDKNNI